MNLERKKHKLEDELLLRCGIGTESVTTQNQSFIDQLEDENWNEKKLRWNKEEDEEEYRRMSPLTSAVETRFSNGWKSRSKASFSKFISIFVAFSSQQQQQLWGFRTILAISAHFNHIKTNNKSNKINPKLKLGLKEGKHKLK